MAKDRRSRNQKRKSKLAKRQQKSRKNESLAYTGNKYKTDELVPVWLHAEMGIYQAFVMTDRTLLDQTVASAVETLIRQIRSEPLPQQDETAQLGNNPQDVDFVIWNIRHCWDDLFEKKRAPSRENRIGVLRTILGSIEHVPSSAPRSQRYLQYIEEFLEDEFGFSVEVSPEDEPEPEFEEEVLLGPHSLICADDQSGDEFRIYSDSRIISDNSDTVVSDHENVVDGLVVEPANIVADSDAEPPLETRDERPRSWWSRLLKIGSS